MDDLKEIGALIKAKRKEMQLTLKEVENSTSIRSSYLEAIEEGRINDLLAGIYAQGFIKQYAQFLGMDSEQFSSIKMSTEKHEFSYGIGTLEVRGSMGGGVKWLPNLIWAGISAVVLLIAWYLARYLGVL